MEHLKLTHGSDVVKIKASCETENLDVYMKPIGNYNRYDYSPAKFHDFPRLHGWDVGADSRLSYDEEVLRMAHEDEDSKPPGNDLKEKRAAMLQTWLFFGLIYTIVRNDAKPFLKFSDLRYDRNVSTKHLVGALEQWYKYVVDMARDNLSTARLYMVEVELVLRKAKAVVRSNCGFSTSPGKDEKVLDQNHLDYVSNELALTLMVLGETLSSWKGQVIQATKTSITGWHDHQEEHGWGLPRYVFEGMEVDGWCKRKIHVLQSQLGSDATLLLAAYFSQRDNKQRKDDAIEKRHQKCTREDCKMIVGDQKSTKSRDYKKAYNTKHTLTCKLKGCEDAAVKPNLGDIHNKLKDDEIPLLTIERTTTRTGASSFALKVESHPGSTRHVRYGAISHVWSDGWGNEVGNWLYPCQIAVIFRALNEAAVNRRIRKSDQISPEKTIPFWMDTLVIPVIAGNDNTDRTLRTRAIQQIGRVFSGASLTVVLDNGLISMQDDPDTQCQTGMRILTSTWNTRLWTLQEVADSKKIYVMTYQSSNTGTAVLDLDDILHDLFDVSGGVGPGSFTRLTMRHLSDSIMNTTRKRGGEDASSSLGNQPFMRIVDTWRAARWRNTSNHAHEPLALALLMNLPYGAQKNSKITLSSWKQDLDTKEQDEMIKEFWVLFDREYEGKIPGGLIFLPQDKVQLRGFGWAPRSFMVANRLDYPDPFLCERPTRLDPYFGLKVHYPGIMLYCHAEEDARERIIDPPALPQPGDTSGTPPMSFPVDAYNQRYAIAPTDDIPENGTLVNAKSNVDNPLAIIMPEPNPRVEPASVALLVEIYKTQESGGHGQAIYYCQLVRRIKIWRYVHNGPSPTEESRQPCIGAMLGPDQVWYVDRIDAERQAECSGKSSKDKKDPKDRTRARVTENVGATIEAVVSPGLFHRSTTGNVDRTAPSAESSGSSGQPGPSRVEDPQTTPLRPRATFGDAIRRGVSKTLTFPLKKRR